MSETHRKLIVVGSRLARRHDLRFEASLHPDDTRIIHVGGKDDVSEALKQAPSFTRLAVVSKIPDDNLIEVQLGKFRRIDISQARGWLGGALL